MSDIGGPELVAQKLPLARADWANAETQEESPRQWGYAGTWPTVPLRCGPRSETFRGHRLQGLAGISAGSSSGQDRCLADRVQRELSPLGARLGNTRRVRPPLPAAARQRRYLRSQKSPGDCPSPQHRAAVQRSRFRRTALAARRLRR